MPKGQPDDRDLATFFPRISLLLVGGFALFLISAGLYLLPVLQETPPPGAIPDWRKERVASRMEGKVLWFLGGSMLTAAALGLIPRTRATRRR